MNLADQVAVIESAVEGSLPAAPTDAERRMTRIVAVAIAAALELYREEIKTQA